MYLLVSSVTVAAETTRVTVVNEVAPTLNGDITAPSVPTGGAPHGTFETTNDFDFTWSAATDDHSEQVTYEFQSAKSDAVDNSGSLVNPWNSIKDGTAEQNHLTSPKMHSGNLPDDTYYWQVRAIDAAGNKSDWSSTWNVTVDTVHPTLVINQPADGETFGGPGREKITVESYLEDSNGLDQYHIDMDGAAPQRRTTDTNHRVAASASLTVFALFNASDFSNGQHTVNVRVTDKAGNITTASRVIIIDNPVVVPDPPAPTLTIDEGVQGRTISGTVSDPNAAFSIKVDGVVQDGIEVRIGSQIAGGYKWSFTLPPGILSDVEHSIEVTASVGGKDAVAESWIILLGDAAAGSGEGYIPNASDLLPGQLGESLRQPFMVPDTFGSVPFAPSDTKTAETDTLNSAVLGAQTTKDPSADQNAKTVAVAATEGGWKLFGLYWYWWVLIVSIIVVAMMRLRMRARQRLLAGSEG